MNDKKILIFFGFIVTFVLLVICCKDVMAVSFDYYSYQNNPPLSRGGVPPSHEKIVIQGRLADVIVYLPSEPSKKGLDFLKTALVVETETESIEFVVEKFEFLSNREKKVEVYPLRLKKEIERGEMSIEEARERLFKTKLMAAPVAEGGSDYVAFHVLDYKEPFKNLTLIVKVRILGAEEEIIEKEISLYRGTYKFGPVEYFRHIMGK